MKTNNPHQPQHLPQPLPQRLSDAVDKLYRAYVSGRLEAHDCSACAVGNILNGFTGWHLRNEDEELATLIKNKVLRESGYTLKELLTVESLFMYGVDDFREATKWSHPYPEGAYKIQYDRLGGPEISAGYITNEYSEKQKLQRDEAQLKGLFAVIDYLCHLDGVPSLIPSLKNAFKNKTEPLKI